MAMQVAARRSRVCFIDSDANVVIAVTIADSCQLWADMSPEPILKPKNPITSTHFNTWYTATKYATYRQQNNTRG